MLPQDENQRQNKTLVSWTLTHYRPETSLSDKDFISLSPHRYEKWQFLPYIRGNWHSESINYFSKVSKLSRERDPQTQLLYWLLNCWPQCLLTHPLHWKKKFYFLSIEPGLLYFFPHFIWENNIMLKNKHSSCKLLKIIKGHYVYTNI